MEHTLFGLKVALVLLMLAAALELSFISSMVAWLHATATGSFTVATGSGSFLLRGEPADLMTDQGHTSNGAAGTAFVLIGIGGILALFLRSRAGFAHSAASKAIYYLWLGLNVPAALLTLGALAYVFAVTRKFRGQTIDVAFAQRTAGERYPVGTWTPQGWFDAVLKLNIASEAERGDILTHYRLMLGWQYNLIPFAIIHLAETALAFIDYERRRRGDSFSRRDAEKADRAQWI
jgi:hypothetical protein